MRSFFKTGAPLEIEGHYKMKRVRREWTKKYYQDVNLTMDAAEAKKKNWTLSNSTYVRFKNRKDRQELQKEIVGDFAKKVRTQVEEINA